MSNKFFLTIKKENIAKQVARLLNAGGQLGQKQTYTSILNNWIKYFIELEGENVVGVIGVEKKTFEVSELKHLCVDPNKRSKGLGQKLLTKAIEGVETPYMYGVVREDNFPSIHNNIKHGLLPIAKCRGIRGELIIFARKKNHVINGNS